jgi:hypothetical protein
MRILDAILTLMVILLPSAAAQEAKLEPEFVLIISAPQQTVKLGLPILMKVKMENVSDHEIGYGTVDFPKSGESWRDFDILITDENGKPVPKTERGERLRPTKGRTRKGPPSDIVSAFRMTIQPGAVRETPVDLAKDYELSKPGVYKVQAERADWKSGTTVKSNTIRLTLTP